MPYRIDLFAVFIFLGIIQAVFLSVFFFSKDNRKIKANLFHGFLLLSMAACILEIFLMYTGYIVDCLYLVDFSEPISLAIGPFFYLMIISLTQGSVKRRDYLHFALPVIYLVLVMPFFLAPEDVKYNAWVESFKLDLPYRNYDYDRGDPRTFWLTDHHTELTLASLTLYAILGLIQVGKAFRRKGESFLRPVNPVLRKLRAGAFQVGSATVFILIIKLFNPNDTGDHIFAAYISISVYLNSFGVIRQSGFFRQATLDDIQKYKGSLVTGDQQQNILQKLRQVMQAEKPFLSPDFSLPELAKQIGTTTHILSQVINEGLGKNFFEMTAEYRVDEAKRLLIQKRNIKVEEIAEQVGYNSKSSFNTAFKKITGKTPSEFRSADAV